MEDTPNSRFNKLKLPFMVMNTSKSSQNAHYDDVQHAQIGNDTALVHGSTCPNCMLDMLNYVDQHAHGECLEYHEFLMHHAHDPKPIWVCCDLKSGNFEIFDIFNMFNWLFYSNLEFSVNTEILDILGVVRDYEAISFSVFECPIFNIISGSFSRVSLSSFQI